MAVPLIEPPPVRAVKTRDLSCLPPKFCEEVYKIIMARKSKSCCLDVIPTYILKKTLSAHSQIITRLVNIYFTTSEFPQVPKKTVVTPLIKKAGFDSNTLQNYRPVSNLPFTSKVIEKIGGQRLISHLQDNSFKEELQSAYRAKHSRETALMKGM